MKKRIISVVLSLCLLIVTGCGSRACGDAPVENENTIELAQEDSQSMTEDFNVPAVEGEGPEKLPIPVASNWGLTLTAKDVTPEGMTIVCTQSGGEPTGELNTGSYYVLEQEVQGVWCIVEYAPNMRDKEVGWTAEAWMIPKNDTVEWEVEWEWLYGSLEQGHYRIGKEIMDFRVTGDYDKAMYYAEFEIEE